MILNFGTITAIPNPAAAAGTIGQAIAETPQSDPTATNANRNVYFANEVDATVNGNITLGDGDDTIELFSGSTVTGNIAGGAVPYTINGVRNKDTLILNAATEGGTLNGSLTNFDVLTKTGPLAWEITGILNSNRPLFTEVQQGTLILSGNTLAPFDGSMLVDPGATLQIGNPNTNGGTTGEFASPITDIGNLTFARSDAGLVHANLISGTGQVGQIGTGRTTLAGANTYSGGTYIDNGTLQVSADNNLGAPTGPLTFGLTPGTPGGTLNTTASFTSARTTTINATGTFDVNPGTTLTMTGAIGGAGTLAKADTGTLVLTSANTYSGGTNLNAGTLTLGNANALGTGTLAMADGSTLDFLDSYTVGNAVTLSGTPAMNVNGGLSETLTNTIGDGAAAGTLNKTGDGTLVLTASNTYSGGTTIAAGTLQLGNGGASGSITGDVTDDGTLAFNRSDVVTFPGVISGSGAVEQIGTGATILTADSPYSGGTTVSAGTLAVGDPAHAGAALSGGGPVTISGQGTLEGYGSVTGPVTNNGTIAVGNAGALFAGGPVGTFVINGDLQNGGLINLASTTAPGNVLSVAGNYSTIGANSTLALRTVLNAGGPLSNQFTDRLLVHGDPVGATTVQVTNAGGPGGITSPTGAPTATQGISIVQVAGASTADAFVLQGGSITGGPFRYQLNAYGPGSPNGPASASQSLVGNDGNQWDYRLQNTVVTPGGILPPGAGSGLPGAPPPPTESRPAVVPQVPAYISTPNALFETGFVDLDSLHRRLGEIRDDQILGRDQPVESFFRAYGGVLDYSTNRSFQEFRYNASLDYSALQFGANYKVVDNNNGTLRVGLAGTLGRFWMRPSAIDGPSKSVFNNETLAGIATWQARTGWYVDGIVMGGLFDGNITTADGGGTGMNGTSVAVSLEGGMPFPLHWWNVSIEPQAQLVWQHLNFAHRTDSDGLDVDLGSPDEGMARVGFRLTRPFQDESGMRITPYLKANVVQGIGGSSDVIISGVSFGTGKIGTMVQMGGGVTGTLTHNLAVYGDASWQTDVGGTGGYRGWLFNAGLRFTFGEPPPAPGPTLVSTMPAPAPTRTYLVFFDWDRAELTDRARQIIASAATASTRIQVTRIEVNGYTDSSGTPQYNQGLSVRRAQAVAAELVRDGVPAHAISVAGFGETRPLVPTGPGVREPQNRRVEIILR